MSIPESFLLAGLLFEANTQTALLKHIQHHNHQPMLALFFLAIGLPIQLLH
jgi:hypothetical protein